MKLIKAAIMGLTLITFNSCDEQDTNLDLQHSLHYNDEY